MTPKKYWFSKNYSVICRVEVVLVPKENASNLVEIPKKNVLRLNQN